MLRRFLGRTYEIVLFFSSPIILVLLFAYAYTVGLLVKRDLSNPRFSLGLEPLINYKYWKEALNNQGFQASTSVTHLNSITSVSDFDKILTETKLGRLGSNVSIIFDHIQHIGHLLKVLRSSDVVITSTMGYTMAHINLGLLTHRVEPYIFRLAGLRTLIIPYGGDAYVYRRINDVGTLHALQLSYPQRARQQRSVAKRVDFWVDEADYFLPSGMSLEGFGRWDHISPNCLCIDIEQFIQSSQAERSNVIITHSPNHRGAKGTSYIIEACERLKKEGLDVELKLLEGVSNSDVLRTLASESDIHVDQILMNGYGLNAIEAMAIGLPVIGHLSGDYLEYFSKYSYLNECPIVSASPIDIYDNLKALVEDKQKRLELGAKGEEYVRNHHSYSAFIKMLREIGIT